MDSSSKRAARAATGMWWLFLVTGVLWLLISVVVLRFNITSVASIGVLLGVILLFAGVNEFMVLGLRDVAWKWFHGVLGALFVVGGIWAFIHPIGAFYELASILGFLLVLKGSLDLVGSVIQREVSELWWLGVLTGGLEILLGFWASQQMFAPRAVLILIWVGFFAIFRGVNEIVLAFEMRHAHKELGRHAMA